MAVRLELSSVLVISAIVGAAAFAAGRATSSTSGEGAHAPTITAATDVPAAAPNGQGEAMPPGHPPVGAGAKAGAPSMGADDVPPGHPPMGAAPGAIGSAPMGAAPGEGRVELAWTAPPRWKTAPNASSMRLATYLIPRASGDAEDAELSVMQAGGSIDANVSRWAGQFGAEGAKSLKRSAARIAGLDVTLVEIQGTYDGGMSKDPTPKTNWALLGAIVATPGGAHFFKMTGPVHTVKAARPELDQLVGSLALK